MSQSRDQLPITDSRLELAGGCQLKVVITLRVSTQTHDTIHENQQTISLGLARAGPPWRVSDVRASTDVFALMCNSQNSVYALAPPKLPFIFTPDPGRGRGLVRYARDASC